MEDPTTATTTTETTPPESKTESKKEEIVARIDKVVGDFLSEVANPASNWETCSVKETVSVWRRSDDGSGVYMIKIVGKINFPQETVLKVLFDHSLRRAWDTVIETVKEVEELPNKSKVLYIATKSVVWGIAPRDMIHVRTEKTVEDKPDALVILDVGLDDHPLCPDRAAQGYVRAYTYVSGGLFEPIESGTLYTMVSQVDVKGIIPKMVVNMVSTKATSDWFDSLKKACETYTNGTLKPVE